MTFIKAGVITPDARADLAVRLQEIFQGLNTRLEEATPDHVFLESVFHHKSARSALVLGHARGVAMLAASLRSCPVGEVSPAEVKKAVTGNGRAEKEQVQEMVRILLGLEACLPADASDAVAVAVAGATRAKWSALTDKVAAPSKPRGRPRYRRGARR